jgi:hypothetical protein
MPQAAVRTAVASTRMAVQSPPIRQPAQVVNRTTPVASHYAQVSVRYLENSPIRVRGPVTGQQYEFSGSRPVQPVDARDASLLLQTRFFRRG